MLDEDRALRLQFLARVAAKESKHLQSTDERLFSPGFTAATVSTLETDPDLAERVDAFVGRFSRLQDTLGDKLIPAYLSALGEHIGAVLDNLDRAERLGLIHSADEWMTMRKIRNQMVHEYIEDLTVLTSALLAGHAFVPNLIAASNAILAEIDRRGWSA
jgi:hypothetical protein